MTFGRSTGMPSRSAWNCISRSLTEAPPSTRSSVTTAPPAAIASLLIASSRAALWKAIDSRAARAMCAIVEPRVRPPVGRAEAGESRNEHDAAVVGHAFGELLHLAAGRDGAQAIAQPLHDGAADEDAAFRRVLRRARRLRSAGRDEAVGRGLGHGASVHEHEAAGAVRVLDLPFTKAGLAEQGALLVAGDTADRNRGAEQIGPCMPVFVARGMDRRQEGSPNVERAGQHPEQPGIDGAESELAALGGGARVGDVIEQPGELGAREIRIEDKGGLLAEERFEAALLQRLTRRRRAPVLPDDGVADRLAGGAVPDDGRLALGRDAEGRGVARREARHGKR